MRSNAEPTPPPQDRAATREHLLTVAALAFAESGFRGATVRDICQRAGVNLAAVNYHFRDKQGLYTEVLRRNYQRALDRFPPGGGVPAGAPPEARLHGFIRSFLLRIFSEGPDSCHGRLLAREMTDPTPALDALVADEIRPLAGQLMAILRELLPPGQPEARIRLCMAGVVSQIVFYHHCRPVISRMFPDLDLAAENLDLLADHITRFSLAGIRDAAAQPASDLPPLNVGPVPHRSKTKSIPTTPRRVSRQR